MIYLREEALDLLMDFVGGCPGIIIITYSHMVFVALTDAANSYISSGSRKGA